MAKKKNIIAVVILIIMPILLGSIYLVQQFNPRAASFAETIEFKAVRQDATSARMTFKTSQPAKAQLQCAVSQTEVKFFCGEDKTPVVDHTIVTSDFDVTLSSGTGYYVFSSLSSKEVPVGYIPGNPQNPEQGLTTSAYDDASLGKCAGEDGFDPQLDVNQDGCVYTNDLAELY